MLRISYFYRRKTKKKIGSTAQLYGAKHSVTSQIQLYHSKTVKSSTKIIKYK
jgi:hypothetical protein